MTDNTRPEPGERLQQLAAEAAANDRRTDLDVDLEQRSAHAEPFFSVLSRRLQRRDFLGKGAAGAAALGLGGTAMARWVDNPDDKAAFRPGGALDSLTFKPIAGSREDQITLPPGYTHDVVIRWGDSLVPFVDDLDTSRVKDGALTEAGAAARAAQQFGYNCDAIEYFPLPGPGSLGRENALVCVNHEYTNENIMFPSFGVAQAHPGEDGSFSLARFHTDLPEAVGVMKASHGISVVELVRYEGRWYYVKESFYNRRITGDSEFNLSGPAAGHPLLRTAADPTGTRVLGTLNNCAGGETPWGTYLSAEENVDQYFGNFNAYRDSGSADPAVLAAHARLPLPGGESERGWEYGDERFDVARHPTEALRFGWVVEVDPYDPTATPVKRTALGRFKHECATSITASSGHCVVYSGDDARMEYTYKFVSARQVSPVREENRNLLDEGTLYVARFNDDGSGQWLPLDWASQPALQAEFADQAEVLIHARRAADLLGATPMDRPEDVEANPVTKKVYIACTNNTNRTLEPGSRNFQGRTLPTEPGTANPRGPNRWGHVVEITEAGNDNAALSFSWEIFMLCGDPQAADAAFLTDLAEVAGPLPQNTTYYAGFDKPQELAPIGSPDNLAFDHVGNLWIITDGSQPRGDHDGCFAVPTYGPTRGKLRQFMACPRSAEVCGCEFSQDYESLFFSIQHPGDGGDLISGPSSYWPDGKLDSFDPSVVQSDFIVPRPSLIAVTKTNGPRRIGS
ncbi:MAG: PhoX family phosphatase [Xanthomonadales bacterium]|nr:PhoX family phosphatase [Xanthomonadales bacterium]